MPIIGINCSYKKVTDTDRIREEAFVYKEYFDAVCEAGGVPILLPPLPDEGKIVKALEQIDGLVLVGGFDMDPAAYGQQPHPATKLAEKRRNDFDLALVRAAVGVPDLPILGICQGCQLLNVVHGGDLVQDIPDLVADPAAHTKNADGHPVRIEDDTRLKSIARRNGICVNSFHHQSVGRVGKGLRVAARSEADGVIEAIEAANDDLRFLIGVQWHPEIPTADTQVSRNLFHTFVAEAIEFARTKTR